MTYKIILSTVGIAAMISASACHKNKDNAAMSDEAMPVEVASAVVDSVTLYKEYPGSLIADRTVNVTARVNGTVSAPMYTAGDKVKKGQVLFTISSSTYPNAVKEAEAALATAISNNKYAETHYEAVSKAYEKNAVSQMELEQALNARDQSRSAIKTAESQLADARNDLDKCTVRAEADGHISTNEYSGGNYISGEASPVTLATIYDDATVIANFSIEDASFMRAFENPDNRRLIDYSAIPINFSEKLPHKYTGNLNYMAPNVDASTGTILLQAAVDNPYNELKAGMYCTIRMPYIVDPDAILVRDASLSTDQLGKYLYVVNDSDKVVYTPVKTGDLVNDSMRVVTDGLKPGDRYVTSAMLKVRDGMTVTPVETK
ncbi:MAG: efflux RND transporter periplasmic adaptor subunit [Muribaculaceae bacterium]|nr:efflux RND transporter periplasmic adaptor subunit [Muribaculaceae bacterium]